MKNVRSAAPTCVKCRKALREGDRLEQRVVFCEASADRVVEQLTRGHLFCRKCATQEITNSFEDGMHRPWVQQELFGGN
jgi:hypothetical protein